MNKVIRTAKISDQRVHLGSLTDVPVEIALDDVQDSEETGFVDLETQVEDISGQETDGDATQETTAEDAADPEEMEDGETADEALAGAFESEQPETPEEQEAPTFSALDVENMVEERLKKFEERFQQETEDAYRSGFDDGKNEGLKEGQEQSRAEIERFQTLIQDLQTQWGDHYKNTDLQLVELALAVAKKIVGATVQDTQESVLQAIRECLEYLQDKSRVVIKVNPTDLETVRRHRNDWLESLEGIEQLLIESDAKISQGGCILETPQGDVDAQIEQRLERLRTALTDAIRSGDEDGGA